MDAYGTLREIVYFPDAVFITDFIVFQASLHRV